ncbi:hypothetical protein J1N35_037453 [Gossypium stocksii]|uniref:Reverse transcriptase zinc-binding domain-containing protein n=1 Tax=Gossypium stocksii TaxID=47602 RepID=A0A9D3ZLP9_9ROSI|nr:hypothetical protein J1N35_037453 [Gossypium stocksii]
MGSGVNIWNDAWIPTPGDERVKCRNIVRNFTVVSQLINLDMCTWIEDHVNAIFESNQAEKILTTPLARRNRVDMLIWRYEGLGEYSLKSGYKLLLKHAPQLDIPQSMIDKLCPLCKEADELVDHILRSCTIMKQALATLNIKMIPVDPYADYKVWLAMGFNLIDVKGKEALVITYCAIWYA